MVSLYDPTRSSAFEMRLEALMDHRLAPERMRTTQLFVNYLQMGELRILPVVTTKDIRTTTALTPKVLISKRVSTSAVEV